MTFAALASDADSNNTVLELWRFAKSQKALLHTLIGATVCTFWSWGLLWWTPAFLARSYGFSIGEAGLLLGLINGIGGTVGVLIGGLIIHRVGLRDPRRQCSSLAYGSPFVTDLDKGRRYGTLEDFHNFVKLTYLAPWLHHSGGTVCEPVDVPVNKRHLDMVYAHIRYSDEPFMGSVTTAARAADSIEMCRCLFGAEFVSNHCVILGNVNVNSPLVLDGEASRVIRTYAAANQAAAPTFGTPEPALAYLAIGQLARPLGVSLRCGGNLCASVSAQCRMR